MFLSLTIEDYDSTCVFTTDSIRNTVIDNSSFIRIIYSTKNVMLNGIIITTPFIKFTINKYFNKWRCNYLVNENKDLIQDLYSIEQEILQKVNIKHKTPCYKINEQLTNGFVKIFLEESKNENFLNNNHILLKISGIWVSEEEYGITYKFLLADTIHPL